MSPPTPLFLEALVRTQPMKLSQYRAWRKINNVIVYLTLGACCVIAVLLAVGG